MTSSAPIDVNKLIESAKHFDDDQKHQVLQAIEERKKQQQLHDAKSKAPDWDSIPF